MKTVLIVDDSKLARIVVSRAISALQPNWQNLEASNADTALDIINNQKVDVVLVDYNMPGKNGLEFAGELRALRPAMPVALITANVQDEILASARAVNAAFIPKPVTEDGLRGFITAAAQQLGEGQQ
jgi:CheY-like chemotaxis protein